MPPRQLDYERTFTAVADQVPMARRWVVGLLPDECERRDDAGLVVDEIAANAVRYGAGPSIRVVVAHRPQCVAVEVHETGAPQGRVAPNEDAVREMRELAGSPEAPAPDADRLCAGGRGLPLVEAITGGRWHVRENPRGRVVALSLPGCHCHLRAIRALHPNWGIVATAYGTWKAARSGWPEEAAADLTELDHRLRATEGPRSDSREPGGF